MESKLYWMMVKVTLNFIIAFVFFGFFIISLKEGYESVLFIVFIGSFLCVLFVDRKGLRNEKEIAIAVCIAILLSITLTFVFHLIGLERSYEILANAPILQNIIKLILK